MNSEIANILHSKVNLFLAFFFPLKILEFLRFLYYEEVEFNDDARLAIKLLELADKYVQDDLYDKCMDFLMYNINAKNLPLVFEIAHQQNWNHLRGWCLKSLPSDLTVNDLSELVKLQYHQGLTKDVDLRDKTINLVIEMFQKISLDENHFSLFEDFLIDNLNTDTILTILNFIYDQSSQEDARRTSKQETIKLKNALFDFGKENFQELRETQITKKFPQPFLEDLISCLVEERFKYQKKLVKNTRLRSTEEITEPEEKPKKLSQESKKRKEPANNAKEEEVPEEKPELKKTKKS